MASMGQLRLRFAQNNKTVGVTVDYIKVSTLG